MSENVIVELNLCNYANVYLNETTGIDTSTWASKTNLATLTLKAMTGI